MVGAPGAPLSRRLPRLPRLPRLSRLPRLLGWLPCLLLLGAWAGTAAAGPAIAISPDPLEFYDSSGVVGAPPGTKQTTFYSVRNTGDAPLAVSGMAIAGPDAALMAFDDTYDPFCGTGQSCAQSFSLAPGEERWFMLQCTAAQGGYFAASLGVASNAASGAGTAALSCIGLHPPVIQVSPSSLDFGIAHYCDRYELMCGPFCETRPRTQTLTITNAAPAPSELAFYITPSLPATEDFIVDNACPEDMPCVIGPGGSLPIEITFRPYHIGAHTAPLTIVSQYPGQAPVSIPFYAEGGTGQLTFESPDFLGAVPVGQTLVTTYTVRNTGSSCLSFNGPDLSNASGLALVGTYPPDFMLQAGEAYSWSLGCTPPSVAGAGGFVDFYLRHHGASMATQDVYCEGLGAALAATPGSVDFTGTAEVPIGTSATQRVTVQNIGNLAADLAAITPSDPRFTATLVGGTLPLALAPGATAEIDVTFTPTTNVRVFGTLALDLATGEDATIPVSGDGIVLAATVTPAALDFGRITHPDAPARQLTLHNTGDRALTVNALAIGLPGDFSVSGIASGATIAAGATLTFAVHATPTALGRRRSTLVIDLDRAPDLTVPLTAIAVDGALDVRTADAAPDDYAAELGGVDVDVGPKTSKVTLRNMAAAPMTIATCAIAGDAELAIATPCPLTIAPGATAELAIAFAPTAEAESTALVSVTGTGFATGALQLPVRGTGLDQHVALSAMAVAFPDTFRRPIAAPAQTVTVQNTAATELVLSAIRATGAGFSLIGPASLTLAPGAAQDVTVAFAPAMAGVAAGHLVLGNADDPEVARVALAGRGIGRAVEVGPLAVDLGTVPRGAAVRLGDLLPDAIALRNLDAAATFAVTVTLAGSPELRLIGPDRRTLAPGERATLDVELAAAAAGRYEGTLRIFLDGDPEPHAQIAVAAQVVDPPATGTGSGGGCSTGAPAHGLPLGAALTLVLVLRLRRLRRTRRTRRTCRTRRTRRTRWRRGDGAP